MNIVKVVCVKVSRCSQKFLNNGTDIDLESGEFHSNDVATLLKMFLGELPEPLLTHKHFHAHLKIAGEYWR